MTMRTSSSTRLRAQPRVVLAGVGATLALLAGACGRGTSASPPVATSVASSASTSVATGSATAAPAPPPSACRPGSEPPMPMPGIGAMPAQRVLAPSVCRALLAQLGRARAAALRMPTLQDAIDAGYSFVAAYVKGTGSHFWRADWLDGTFDPNRPEYVLYGGNKRTSRIVGLAFAVYSDTVPDFFVGPNDTPHQHAWCNGPNGKEIPAGTPGCPRSKANQGNLWIIHVWIVPGRASPWGMFSSRNPYLTDKGWDPTAPIATGRRAQGS